MSAETPIEKLENAISEFIRETSDDDGVLTAWVLSTQTSKITSDPNLIPLAFASDYAMGLSTSGETAIGLTHVTKARIERALAWGDDDE